MPAACVAGPLSRALPRPSPVSLESFPIATWGTAHNLPAAYLFILALRLGSGAFSVTLAIASKLPSRTVATHELTWVPIASLTLPTSPPVDVYASKPKGEPQLLWRRDSRLNDDDLAEMRRYDGEFSFWVSKVDYRRIADALTPHWRELLGDQRLPQCDRIALCEMAHALELNATLALKTCKPYVQLATQVALELTSILCEGPISSRSLFYAIQNATTPSARAVQIACYTCQMARLGGEKRSGNLGRIAFGGAGPRHRGARRAGGYLGRFAALDRLGARTS